MKESVMTNAWRFMVTLLLFALLTTYAQAQESEKTHNNRENSLKKGKWAFQVGDLFNVDLRSLYGASLALKKHTSNSSALRFGLGLGFNLSDQDRTSERDGEISDQLDYNRNDLSVNIVVQKIFYPAPNADVNFFYGFGPLTSFSYSESKQEHISAITKTKSESYTWSVGFSGVLGAEWFPARSVSLLVEYGSNLKYSWQKATSKYLRPYSDDTNLLVSESNIKSFSIGMSSVKVGLSVYF